MLAPEITRAVPLGAVTTSRAVSLAQHVLDTFTAWRNARATEKSLLRLSDQQFRILDMLDAERRVAVAGPAGSGKTLAAAEKARRLATQGFDVLFTCFNRPLADHLRKALADEPRIRVAGADCSQIDRLEQGFVHRWRSFSLVSFRNRARGRA